jgi:hypothetical protein
MSKGKRILDIGDVGRMMKVPNSIVESGASWERTIKVTNSTVNVVESHDMSEEKRILDIGDVGEWWRFRTVLLKAPHEGAWEENPFSYLSLQH